MAARSSLDAPEFYVGTDPESAPERRQITIEDKQAIGASAAYYNIPKSAPPPRYEAARKEANVGSAKGSPIQPRWRQLLAQRRYQMILAFVILIIIGVIIGVVVGTVVGTRGGQEEAVEESPSERLNLNSGIASTTCPDGGRWVFVQDANNDIRVLRLVDGSWISDPPSTIEANARPGTPMSATCIGLPAQNNDSPFRDILVSLVYIEPDDYIGQACYSNSAWRVINTVSGGGRVLPLAFPSSRTGFSVPAQVARVAPDSPLSLSTTTDGNVDDDGLPILRSIATYRGFNSVDDLAFWMLDVWTNSNFGDDPINRLENFGFMSIQAVNPGTDIGELENSPMTTVLGETRDWHCAYNLPFSEIPQTRGEFDGDEIETNQGNLGLACFNSGGYGLVNYRSRDLNLSSDIFGLISNLPGDLEPPADNTKFFTLSIPETTGEEYGIMYATSDNLLAFAYFTPENQGTSPVLHARYEWRTLLPTTEFSSSIGRDSVMIHNHFIDNPTTVAEVTLNIETGEWSEPEYFGLGTPA